MKSYKTLLILLIAIFTVTVWLCSVCNAGMRFLPYRPKIDINRYNPYPRTQDVRPCLFDTKIMPLGDSITVGSGSDKDWDKYNDCGYRRPLYLMLKDAGYCVDFVGSHHNRGGLDDFDWDYQGDYGKTAEEMVGEVDGHLEKNRPQIVLLHIGTNDLLKGTSPRNTKNYVNQILNKIDRYENDSGGEVTVIMAYIIDAADIELSRKISIFNQELRQLAIARSNRGDDIYTVDMAHAIIPTFEADGGDIYQDALGVHPNAEGYEKMAGFWFDVLDPLLSSDFSAWNDYSPPIYGSLYGTTYKNGNFVSVGYRGAILTSLDGEIWDLRYSGTTRRLYGVTCNEDLFVAVGYGGTILTSTDNITWQQVNSRTRTTLLDVTYGNGTFVAVGYRGLILTSKDGRNWRQGYSWLDLRRITLRSVTHAYTPNGSVFVAVGNNGHIAWSRDTRYWHTARARTNAILNGVVYCNSEFIAVGTGGTVVRSFNGVDWSSPVVAGSEAWLYDVACINDSAIAVGENGKMLTCPIDVANGEVNWHKHSSGISNHLFGVTSAENSVVAVGAETILQCSP